MARPIDWISTDPGGEPLNVARLHIDQFSNMAQERLSHIEDVKQRLERLCQPFNSKGTILPITCKEAISTLSELRDRVDEFCALLAQTSRLPIIVTALRYEILYGLCLIKEQARQLEDLIDNYRVICMAPLPSSGPRRRQISDAFQHIFQQISDTSQQVKFQGDAARLQERRLISLLENH